MILSIKSAWVMNILLQQSLVIPSCWRASVIETPFLRSSQYEAHLFAIMRPQEKQRIGMSIQNVRFSSKLCEKTTGWFLNVNYSLFWNSIGLFRKANIICKPLNKAKIRITNGLRIFFQIMIPSSDHDLTAFKESIWL